MHVIFVVRAIGDIRMGSSDLRPLIAMTGHRQDRLTL